MLKAILAIEIYKNMINLLPNRFRVKLKHYINEDRSEWVSLGIRKRTLAHTSYQVSLELKHWHQRWTYIKGFYPETQITTILSKELKPDSIFIDIGAHIGVHSLFAAARIENPSQIWSVEPNPHSFARLKEHIQDNRLTGIHLHQVALGNQNGIVHLQGSDDGNVGSTLRNTGEGGAEVPIYRGDELFAQIPGNAIGLCKIDVEGFELEVLRGMPEFLKNHPQIAYIIEVTPDWLVSLGDSAEALFKVFFDQGFQAYEIQEGSAKLHQLHHPIDKPQYDVFFSKQPLANN